MLSDLSVEVPEELQTFGLVGGFPGDDFLWKEIQWCRQMLVPQEKKSQQEPSDNLIPENDFSRLITLFERLPYSSRNILCATVLALSPYRNELLKKLFDYCIWNDDECDLSGNTCDKEEEQDMVGDNDEFVVLLTDSTTLIDTSKYHIIKAILVLMPFCDATVAIAISRRYMRSASTRYQGSFLSWCTKQPVGLFPDHELWEFYRDSPGLVQSEVLKTCRELQPQGEGAVNVLHPRETFLCKVLDHTNHDATLVFWCSSSYLETKLNESFISALGLQRWSVHSQLYVKYIRSKLMSEANPLKRGQMWIEMQKGLPKRSLHDLKPVHVHTLISILGECQVLQLEMSLPQNVINYLERDVAESGKDISKYVGAKPVLLSPDIVSIIPRKERAQDVLQAVVRQDFQMFETYKSLVEFSALPFKQAFQNASADDLWNVVSGKYNLSTANDAEKFFHFFASTDFTGNCRRAFTIDTLWEWHMLHVRATPDKLTPEQRQVYALAACVFRSNDNKDDQDRELFLELWRLWFRSLISRYIANNHAETAVRRVRAAQEKHRLQERSKVTLEARYAHEILVIALEGIHALPKDLEVVDNVSIIDKVLKPVLSLYGALRSGNHLTVVRNLNMGLTEALLELFIPRLQGVLCFDPAANNQRNAQHYITRQNLDWFHSQTMWLAGCMNENKACGDVLHALLQKVLAPVLAQASANDHHVSLPNGLARFDEITIADNKIDFVYFDSRLHQLAISNGVSTITKIIQTTRTIKDYQEDHALIWDLMMRYFISIDKLNTGNYEETSKYLNMCGTCLPDWLFRKERGNIVKFGISYALQFQKLNGNKKKKTKKCSLAEYFHPIAQRLHSLGPDVLEEVLASDPFNEDDRKSIFLGLRKFQYEGVQDELKKKTTGMDADTRATGHMEWLRAAFQSNSLSHAARAIEFSANRIQNEAGIQRGKIYECMVPWLRAMISSSLGDPSEENRAAVENLTSSFEQMLRNDLSRRDSVGRHGAFRSVPAETIQLSTVKERLLSGTEGPVLHQHAKLLQLWISFAIRLEWIYVEAEKGESGLMAFRWPGIQRLKLPMFQQIPAKLFDQAYPLPHASGELSQLRTKVDLVTTVVDERDIFGPNDFVACLNAALDAVWDAKFPCGALSWQSAWLPMEQDVSSGLLDRLTSLIKFCDISWEEVPVLVEAFDKMFASIEEAPKYHVLLAGEFLDSVMGIYGESQQVWQENTYFYEIPRLAYAVDAVFRIAVKEDYRLLVDKWYNPWCKMILEQGRRDWNAVPNRDTVRFMSFLARNGMGCEPPSCRFVFEGKADSSNRAVVLARELANRRAILARDLLAMSPSAVVKQEVKDALESDRQDLAEKFLDSPLFNKGPFAKDIKMTNQEFLYSWLRPSSLSQFPPAISRQYANFALSRASDPNMDVSGRVMAIENFVNSPSTNHREAMHALQNDGIDNPTREAIIVKVFSLDSPWHVVSFLLNSSLKHKEQQRMTASLLSHVAKHVQVDKVVGLLAMLHAENRRSRLGMQLRKAIVRMLFDNQTQESHRLLQTEWDLNHSKFIEIRHIILGKCIEAVLNRPPGQSVDWEWGIIQNLVEQADQTQNEILIQLFIPSWKITARDLFSTHLFSMKSEDETIIFLKDQFSSNLQHIAVRDDETRERYRSLIQILEERLANKKSWNMVAKVYRLSLSITGCPEDAIVVNEMAVYLQARKDVWDEVEQFGTKATAWIFGYAVGLNLVEDSRKNPAKDIVDICNGHTMAKTLRQCVSHLLTMILDAPLRQMSIRQHSMLALRSMMEGLQESGNSNYWTALVEDLSDIAIIRQDASMTMDSVKGYM
ncbi:hypothetical protein ACA910_008705 [Epithemia clementina (nom. ined.)]